MVWRKMDIQAGGDLDIYFPTGWNENRHFATRKAEEMVFIIPNNAKSIFLY